MPRPGPRKPQLAVRVPQEVLDAYDDAAAEKGTDRSAEVVRRLDWADRTMPKDYEVGAKLPKRLARA